MSTQTLLEELRPCETAAVVAQVHTYAGPSTRSRSTPGAAAAPASPVKPAHARAGKRDGRRVGRKQAAPSEAGNVAPSRRQGAGQQAPDSPLAAEAGLRTWRVVHGGAAFKLAFAPSSAAAEIEDAIKRVIGAATSHAMRYELADGTALVINSGLPDGIEVHCKAVITSKEEAAPSPAPKRSRTEPQPQHGPPRGPAHRNLESNEMVLRIQPIDSEGFDVCVRKDDTLDVLRTKIAQVHGACTQPACGIAALCAQVVRCVLVCFAIALVVQSGACRCHELET